MQQNLQKKRGLVKKVFDNVYNKYDLMNDFMSLGIHRQWKRELIRQMNPYPESSLIDVACGTGDIAKLYADNTSDKSKILIELSELISALSTSPVSFCKMIFTISIISKILIRLSQKYSQM